MLRSLTGLGTLQQRFQELAARFTYHLDLLSPSNPARILMSACSPSSLLRLCSRHDLRTELDLAEERISPLRLSEFFGQKRLGRLERTSTLCRNITVSCRKKPSFVDSALLIRNAKLRKLALSWRRNVFGIGSICQVCSRSFNRGHVSSCCLAGPSILSLDDLLNLKEYVKFQVAIQRVKSKISR